MLGEADFPFPGAIADRLPRSLRRAAGDLMLHALSLPAAMPKTNPSLSAPDAFGLPDALVLAVSASSGMPAGAGGLPRYRRTVGDGPRQRGQGNHGAWQVSCRLPPGAKEEKCALVQSVTAEDRPNVGLTVVFYKAIGEDKKLLRVVVPLGVLLPTGLGLKIDDRMSATRPSSNAARRAASPRSCCKTR